MPTHCRLPEHTTAHPEFGFDWALRQLRGGGKVCRRGWNGKSMFLVLVQPISPEHEERLGQKNVSGFYSFINGPHTALETCEFIAMKTADNKLVPWLASQTDLLAADWELSTHCTAVATAA